ncbi:MAG TPA: cupin domain-containing protein [Solirubrobacteraceae bacterium]|nr:cupin domain-containing protein [Solirubrobacteraceae bacterium]
MSATPRPVVNALSAEVEPADWGNPPGFQTRYRELGPLLGGKLLGGTIYELDPGERNGPYHYELGNEECVLVLEGAPTLRHPDGRDVLTVGDMIMFTDGEAGAHQLINESRALARVLILSTMREPYACAYPDSGKISTIGGIFRLAETVEYWEGESAE